MVKTLIIILILTVSVSAEDDDAINIYEIPLGYQVNSKEKNDLNVSLSYRRVFNKYFFRTDKGLQSLFNLAPRMEVGHRFLSSTTDVSINPASIHFLNPEFGFSYKNKVEWHVGVEINFIMFFSWVFLPNKLKIDESGKLNKLVEPYYRYKLELSKNNSMHEVGIRLGYAWPSIDMRK